MFRPIALLALTALSLSLAAEDFGPVVKAAGLIYQGKSHFGVVCNYDFSKSQVADLQRALPEGSTLTVVDVRHPMMVGAAASSIVLRGVQMLALLPKDPVVRDGSLYATTLVHQVQAMIPAFGTTPKALENGSAFALGQATDWEVLVNPKLLDPTLPGIVGPAVFSEMTRETKRGGASRN